MDQAVEEVVEKDYDRWLLSFATLCLIVSTTLILDERLLFKLKSKGHGSTVAKISNTTNDVRRRVIGDLAFFRAEDSDTLFNGDTIFTGTDSSSLISFKSGSTITLNPETMIVIESDGQENGLNVKKGSFTASISKGASLLVNVGNEKKLFNGDNAKILVSKDANGNAQIKVQKGSVLVSGPKGQTRMSATEPVIPKPAPQPVQAIQKSVPKIEAPTQVVRDVPPEIFNGKMNEKLTLHNLSHSSIQLQWQSSTGETDYVIQVSKEKDFSTTLYNQAVKGTAFKLTPTSFGNYYWRVKAHSSWSSPGVVSIAQAKEPAPAKVPRAPAKIEVPKVEAPKAAPKVEEPKKGGYQAFEFSD